MYENAVKLIQTCKQTRNYMPNSPSIPKRSESARIPLALPPPRVSGNHINSQKHVCIWSMGMLPVQSLHGDHLVITSTIREPSARERQSKRKEIFQYPISKIQRP